MNVFDTKTEVDATPHGEPVVRLYFRRRGEQPWNKVTILLKKGQLPELVDDFADELAARLLEGHAA